MSISKRLKELENMLSEYDSIFYKLEELKNPIVGVVWCDSMFLSCNSGDFLYSVADGTGIGHFQHFTKKDITDNVNGHIKICSTWFSVKDVIFYDDVYNKQKDVIEKRKAKKKWNNNDKEIEKKG